MEIPLLIFVDFAFIVFFDYFGCFLAFRDADGFPQAKFRFKIANVIFPSPKKDVASGMAVFNQLYFVPRKSAFAAKKVIYFYALFGKFIAIME